MGKEVEKAAAADAERMCILVRRLGSEELGPLVRDPKFVCKSCGQVVGEKEYLCNPESRV